MSCLYLTLSLGCTRSICRDEFLLCHAPLAFLKQGGDRDNQDHKKHNRKLGHSQTTRRELGSPWKRTCRFPHLQSGFARCPAATSSVSLLCDRPSRKISATSAQVVLYIPTHPAAVVGPKFSKSQIFANSLWCKRGKQARNCNEASLMEISMHSGW